jgi:hypothetical protein
MQQRKRTKLLIAVFVFTFVFVFGSVVDCGCLFAETLEFLQPMTQDGADCHHGQSGHQGDESSQKDCCPKCQLGAISQAPNKSSMSPAFNAQLPKHLTGMPLQLRNGLLQAVAYRAERFYSGRFTSAVFSQGAPLYIQVRSLLI